MGAGWIYALNNPGHPEILKIGMTEIEPMERAQAIYETGVVYPFVLVHAERVADARAAERFLHDLFSKQRVNPNREFFRVTPEHAILAMKEAVNRYPPITESGHGNAGLFSEALAQAFLGMRYLNGLGVSQSYTEAARLLEFASNQGLVSAHIILANLYSKGQGVSQSDLKAAQLLERAAFDGNATGQYLLGFVYEVGRGRPQSYKRARNLYRASSDQGNTDAQCALGRFLLAGLGGPKSELEAFTLFKLSATTGHAEGQALLNSMLSAGYRAKPPP